jgi:hypothetical protein
VASRAASRVPSRAGSRPPNRVATPMGCRLTPTTMFCPCTAPNKQQNSLVTKATRGKDAVAANGLRTARGFPHQQRRAAPLDHDEVAGRQRRSSRRKNGEMRTIDVVSPKHDKNEEYYFVGTRLFQVQEIKFILVPMGGPTIRPPLKPG